MHQTQWGPERPLPPPVSLASQSHHEKPPEVTCTSRGNPGFPASTRERPRETFFNTSRGHIPLPWLGSNDALPLATRMETRLPWRPTRGSLTSPSYLVRNRTLGPPLENNPEIPPSSREEGLRLLHQVLLSLADDALRAAAARQQQWLDMIDNALEQDGFLLYYQPVVNLQGEEGEFYEVLLRMRGPTEEVMPAHFMPIAERNDRLLAIDRWVIG